MTTPIYRSLFATLALVWVFAFVSVSTQAATAAVTAGRNVTLSSSVSGTAPFTFQWYKNGTILAGATTNTFLITNFQAGNAGNYYTIVSNTAGSTTSDTAILTLNTVAPIFSTQPASKTVIVGNSCTFSATASGTPTYQWQKNNVNITGATNSSYTIASTNTGNAGSYTLIATNLAGSTKSNIAVLSITVPPTFTTQPNNYTVSAGSSITFTAVANGTPAPSYQWQKEGTNISGATSNTYTVASASAGNSGNYRVIASNSAGNTTSSVAILTVQSTPIISSQPSSQTVINGTAATFTVLANSSPAPTYQWLKNGVDIIGATDNNYDINVTQLADSAGYSVRITNAAGSITSNIASLTVALDWKVCGTGDFNADGQTDLLWRKSSTGAVAVWLMNGTTYLSTSTIATVTTDWQISGTGDFNSDGKIDILWRKTSTGAVAVWIMNGSAIQSTALIATITSDWQIAGTGDFDVDGKLDILWRNNSTGAVAVWIMNGITIQSVSTIATVASDWQIAGTGDFNSDGKVDILWRKISTGAVALWFMNAITIQSTGVITTVTPDWQIAGTGDFNSDNKVDIIWRKSSTGAVAAWLMNGATMQSSTILGSAP